MTTSIVEFEPVRELADLRSRLDQLFGASSWSQTVPINLSRQDGSLMLSCDVPGMKADDIEVEVEGNRLTIQGQRHDESEDKGQNFLYRERSFGSFSRTVTLPPGIDKKNIKARIDNGVLKLDIKLPDDETKKEKIAIEEGEKQ